jgi:hypothetical protein
LTAGGSSASITETISIYTSFADSIVAAEIQISENYESSEDILNFTDTNSITGSWNSATGTLTLVGKASVADYETALKAITYQNTDASTPNLDTRTISISVSDPFYTSNASTRDAYVIQTLSDPSTDIADVVFHYDGQDIDGDLDTSDQSSSTNVSSWVDRSFSATSGTSVNILNSAPSTEPFFDPEYFGERGAIKFNRNIINSGSGLTLESSETLNLADNYDAKSFAVIFRTSEKDLTGLHVVYEQGGRTSGYSISIKDGQIYAFSWSNNWQLTQYRSINLGVANKHTSYIVVANHDANTGIWEAKLNDEPITQHPLPVEQMPSHNGNAIIGLEKGTVDPADFVDNPVTQNAFDGYIAEIVSWNTALSGGQMGSLYSYFCDKWCNEAPLIDGIENLTLDYTEGESGVNITNTINLTDVDNTLIDSAKVIVTSNYDLSEDSLGFTDTANITSNWDLGTGTLTLSGKTTLEDYETALRSVTYSNTNQISPNTTIRQVDFKVFDWNDSSNVQTRSINIINVNTSPILSGVTGGVELFIEGDPPSSFNINTTITNVDDSTVEGAKIKIINNYFKVEDVLSFNDTENISSYFDIELGELTLTGTASIEEYQTALNNVLYQNKSANPIEILRTVSFTVYNGIVASNTEIRDFNVSTTNSGPLLSNIETTNLIYSNSQERITNTIKVNDPEDSAIDSMVVQITNNLISSEDSLIYNPVSGIIGNYDKDLGKMLLTGSSSYENYELALRSILYTNNAPAPSGATRELSFQAYDVFGAPSNIVNRYIEVNAVESINGLTLWLRADKGLNTTISGEVITWEDQSGNSNHFIGNSGSGLRPTLINSSSYFDNQPAIDFIGDGDYFEDDDGENYINGTSELSIFIVSKSDAMSNNRGLWITDIPDGTDEIFSIRNDVLGLSTMEDGIKIAVNNSSLESSSNIQSKNGQILNLNWKTGSTYEMYINGILNNPYLLEAIPNIEISGATTVLLGKGPKDISAGRSWNGQVAEVILYNKKLNDHEREKVEEYLSDKYNLLTGYIVPASNGSNLSADDTNLNYTTLIGPSIQERVYGELQENETFTLVAPNGFEWNVSSSPSTTITNTYGGTTDLDANFTSLTSSEVTFTITKQSTIHPGKLTINGLEIRPTTGFFPNEGYLKNIGTTGQGGNTNYGNIGIIAGAPYKLNFSTEPTNTAIDSIITPYPKVSLLDQFGNTAEQSSINVNMSKQGANGTLSGDTNQTTNSLGIIEFSDLKLNETGQYKLIAQSTGLVPDTSIAFNIVPPGELTAFVVERYPSGNISTKKAGQDFKITIKAIDGTGETITSYNGKVSISSPCALDSGVGSTANFTDGLLSSHTISFSEIGSCKIIATNNNGAEKGYSNTFTVTPGFSDPTLTIITASPSLILNDGISSSTIHIQLKDSFGNHLTSTDKAVEIFSDAGSLGSLINNNDGTATINLTSSNALEIATITGTLDGVIITDEAEVEFSSFSHIWTSQLGSSLDASNWFDTQNWNTGTLPSASSVVLIPTDPDNGNEFPVIKNSNTTIQELALETKAKLFLNGNINLTVSNEITGDGYILGSNTDSITIKGNIDLTNLDLGTIIFNSSSPQTIINPYIFNNLVIDNNSQVLITDDVKVEGMLSLIDGEVLIPSGKNLIANTQSYVNGELRFQREITGNRGWRMLSSPVSSNYGDFFDGMITQGYDGAFYSTGSMPGDTLQPNILTYLESYPGTDNQRFRAPANSSENLVQGQGIWAYFFGDIENDSRYNDPLPDTLDVKGQEFPGNGTEVDFGITYTTSADSGWNFIGNPFGASINWDDEAQWTKTNVESSIYIWDPAANNGNGEYLTWNGVTGTLGDGLISPFQGFWVKANGPSPSLKVKLNAKTTGDSFLRKGIEKDIPVIQLDATIDGLHKRTNIMFSENGNYKKDKMDALRLIPFSNTHVEFYSILEDGSQLSINNLPKQFNHRIHIPLILNAYKNGLPLHGEYQLDWEIHRTIPEEWLIYLIDHSTGEIHDMKSCPDLSITHSVSSKLTKNSSPIASNFKLKGSSRGDRSRFTLRITTEEIEANIPEQFYLSQNYPNPFNPSTTIEYGLNEAGPVSLIVYDIIGRKIQTLVDQNQFEGNYKVNFNASSLASGVYFYRLIAPNKILTKKMTLIK